MNGKRVGSLLLACCLLAWVLNADRVEGCGCSGSPPGNPNCCWCASGVWVCQCTSYCGTGWNCSNGCCYACNAWDTGDPIAPDGYVYVWPKSVPICYQWVMFGSEDMEDWDHYVRGTFWGYGTEEHWDDDELTYQWSTNPATGEWDPRWGTDWDMANWKAGPCIGTVQVILKVNDKPSDAMDPCPGYSTADRDDTGPVTFTDSVQVTLPTGCNQGDGGLEINLIPKEFSGEGCSGNCGYFHVEEPVGSTAALYKDCNWECLITITQDYEWGVCDQLFTEISDASDSDITSANYCYLVHGFKYDPNTGTGCFNWGGGPTYSNHACDLEHEKKHRDDYVNAVNDLYELILATGELTIPIVCSDPNSPKTCQSADSQRCLPLGNAIALQMQAIYVEIDSPPGELRAKIAAQKCFKDLGDSICTRASGAGWPSCAYCSQ